MGGNFRVRKTHCSRFNPWHDIKFCSILKEDKIELYHAIHSWLPIALPKSIKKIITVHDLFAIIDDDFFAKYKPFHKLAQKYFIWLMKHVIKEADAIVTVSNYGKKELSRIFPASEGKTEIISNASGISIEYNIDCEDMVVNGDYLLYVGNCRSYKNIETLINGFDIFLQNLKKPDIKLVIAGNDNYYIVRAMVKELGLQEKVIFLENPGDLEVVNLYKKAKAFIFPSKYEGFGIPMLEAMSFGVPVISSDAEALVEIADGATVIFNRCSPEELANSIELIISDSNLRNILIQKGYNRVKEFTWDKSALKLKKLYEKLLCI